jgi:hypothetical protein
MLFRNFYPCATCGYEGFVRVRLILVAANASVIGAVPGAAEDRTAPRGHAAAPVQTVSSRSITHLSQFADQTPDGSQLLELRRRGPLRMWKQQTRRSKSKYCKRSPSRPNLSGCTRLR